MTGALPPEFSTRRAGRATPSGHVGAIVWLTGLPGSGKTTLARGAERDLMARGYAAYLLDGDQIRRGLSEDLGFSPADRAENVRRVAHVAALLADAGHLVLVALVSPFRADRASARAIAGRLSVAFHEVYVSADVATCEARDPKGHYAKARRGEMAGFTGVDDSYETPMEPDVVIDTVGLTPAGSLARLDRFITERVPRVAERPTGEPAGDPGS